VAASAVSVAGGFGGSTGQPIQLWPPSGGGVTSDYLTYQTSEIRVTADKSSSRWLPVANYSPRLTAGILRPTPRKRRMVSMNLGTEIGFDK
jgi:hypothetical protein